jgi:hypothetical protein
LVGVPPCAFSLPPARLRDQPLRFQPHREAVRVARRGEGRGPLADRAGAHHVVAEELELVLEPLAQLRQLALDRGAEPGVEALVVQEVDLQPDEVAVLALELQPRVVHAVVVEREERVGRLRVVEGRVQGAVGPRDERLVEHRGDADARRVRLRVERAPLLVLEGLPDAQVVERGIRLVGLPPAIVPSAPTVTVDS